MHRTLGQACGKWLDKYRRVFTGKGNQPLPEKQAIEGFSAGRRALQTVTRSVKTRTDIRHGRHLRCSRCFSVPRWQCLTLPDPSQRWDLYPEPDRFGIFFGSTRVRQQSAINLEDYVPVSVSGNLRRVTFWLNARPRLRSTTLSVDQSAHAPANRSVPPAVFASRLRLVVAYPKATYRQ